MEKHEQMRKSKTSNKREKRKKEKETFKKVLKTRDDSKNVFQKRYNEADTIFVKKKKKLKT